MASRLPPRSAGRSLEARFYMFYMFTPSFICSYTLFICCILLHHHFNLSAQSDIKTNRFGTLGDNALSQEFLLIAALSKEFLLIAALSKEFLLIATLVRSSFL